MAVVSTSAARPSGVWARVHATLLSPALAELSDAAGLRDMRRRLLGEARGATLEIHGFGTGRNLGLYPEAVSDLVLLQSLRFAAPWQAIAVGCHCNYDTLGCLEASPLAVEWFERGALRRFPPLVRPLVLGAAVAPSR